MKAKISLVAVYFIFISLASISYAQQKDITQTRDMEQERIIENRLALINNDLVPTYKAATAALDKQDYKKAEELYLEVIRQAPTFDVAYRRLGLTFMANGNRDDGLKNLEKAYELIASQENSMALAYILARIDEKKEPTPTELARALGLSKDAFDEYMNSNSKPDIYYPWIFSTIAMWSGSVHDFKDGVSVLSRQFPELAGTHFYAAILAKSESNWLKAYDEITKAKELGLDDTAVSSFLSWEVRIFGMGMRYTYYSMFVVGAWILGLIVLFISGKLLSRITLRSVEDADPNLVSNESESKLRLWYRRIITFAGAYYYISLPFVAFLIIVFTVSIIYFFFWLEYIPIKFALLIALGAVITLYKLIRTLFIKIKAEDPGRALEQHEAPGLWDLTRQVASVVGTRPIDEIRVTPGCDLAVYENGSLREKVQDRAHRVLILGVGVLNGMKLNAFRAVLAHEYGHFSHRDTAGGDIALRVNNDIAKFANAIIIAEQATPWNIAYQFLRVYHFIFRRISHGATRLQEIQADRVAVRNFGAAAFEEGLRHVIRRDVEFNVSASKEIEAALTNDRPIKNLYNLSDVDVSANNETIDQVYNDLIVRPTTEDDTHPSPFDRFLLASKIISQPNMLSNGPVWSLFNNPDALTSEMSKLIADNHDVRV